MSRDCIDREPSRAGRWLGCSVHTRWSARCRQDARGRRPSRCVRACRERVALDRAIRGSLKKAVKTSAPDDVRARMLAAMAGETAREAREDASTRPASSGSTRARRRRSSISRIRDVARRTRVRRNRRPRCFVTGARCFRSRAPPRSCWRGASPASSRSRTAMPDAMVPARLQQRRAPSISSSTSTRTPLPPETPDPEAGPRRSSATSACPSRPAVSRRTRASSAAASPRPGRRARSDAPVRGRSGERRRPARHRLHLRPAARPDRRRDTSRRAPSARPRSASARRTATPSRSRSMAASATPSRATWMPRRPRTADRHIQNIYTKISVSTRAAAALWAMQHDVVS